MSQVVPEYEELDGFLPIAEKLKDLYPDIFGEIDIDKIAAVVITNKERSEKKRELVDVKTITPPLTMFCSIEYLFILYLKDWAELSEKHRAVLVAHALQKISPDGDGKVVPPDMKDYSVMLRTFGVDYLDNPDVPDILRGTVNWQKDPPYMDQL